MGGISWRDWRKVGMVLVGEPAGFFKIAKIAVVELPEKLKVAIGSGVDIIWKR